MLLGSGGLKRSSHLFPAPSRTRDQDSPPREMPKEEPGAQALDMVTRTEAFLSCR